VRPFLDPLLVFPDPPPPELAQTLDLAGYPWKAASSPDTAARLEPPDGWTGAVVAADQDPEGAWSFCRTVRKRDVPLAPLLLLVSGAQLADLELRDDLFDDFCLAPFHPRELPRMCREIFGQLREVRAGGARRNARDLRQLGGRQRLAAQQRVEHQGARRLADRGADACEIHITGHAPDATTQTFRREAKCYCWDFRTFVISGSRNVARKIIPMPRATRPFVRVM